MQQIVTMALWSSMVAMFAKIGIVNFSALASAALSPQPGDTMLVTPSPKIYYALSNFLRNSLVLFISFLYLCFFIFSFLCLFTLISNMVGRLVVPR
jgi:hypothetical protein